MYKKIALALLIGGPCAGYAQLRTGAAGNAVLFAGSSTYITVLGNVACQADIAGTGTLNLAGSSQQQLDMGGKKIPALTINNSAGVVLANSAVVGTKLSFTNGRLFTNNQLITLLAGATTQGYTNTTFVATSDAANNPVLTGGLQLTVPAGANVVLPVGANSSSYNPVTIQNTAGAAEQYTVLVNPVPVTGVSSLKTLQTSWSITEATAGGNTVALTLQWNASNEVAGFNRAAMKIVRSSGNVLVEKTGVLTAAGANPYTAAGGAFAGVSVFGATSDPAAFAPGETAFTSMVKNAVPVANETVAMYPTFVKGENPKLIITALADSRCRYVVYDMSGKLITESGLTVLKGQNVKEITLPGMAAGLYLLHVYNGTGLVKTIKFVKG